jgi:hypothetical protein
MSDEPQVQEVDAEAATPAEIEEFRPSGMDLVIADAESVFSVLDSHDEDQVLRMLQGQMVPEWFYKFPQDGQEVVDLSIKGVFDCIHAVNRLGKVRIRVIPGSLEGATVEEDGETFYEATVWAEDQVTGFSVSGHSYEPKRKKLRANTAKKRREQGKPVGEDGTIWNPFAKTVAVNKAERNALAKFIPQRIRLSLIAQFMGDPSRVRQIAVGAGAEQLAELPPALTDERAQELTAKARQVYDEIREANPLAMYPAVFHQRLIHVHHSHDELEVFVQALEKLRDEQQKAKGAAA